MEVKGVAVKTLPKYVSLRYPEIYDIWLGELVSDVRRIFLDGIYSSRWYDVDKFMRQPLLKVAKLVYMIPNELAWDMGEFSAEDALNGIYRFFLRFGGPVNMIKHTPFFLGNYYDSAHLKLDVLNEDGKHAELLFFDFVDAQDVIIYRIAGWGHYTLLASGAKDAKFKIEPMGKNDSKMLIDWE